jgi:hypothetical protein
MAIIALRSTNVGPLTSTQVDTNFTNLNTELAGKLDSSSYSAADVLTKIKTVDGTGSGLDADLLDGLNSASSNTNSTIVARDSSGNFAANVITASLTGNVTGNVVGNLTGNVTGNATNVSGIVPITNGGTGAVTVEAARNALGLGSLSTQASTNVNITGGTIAGIIALGVDSGGTGSANAAGARTNLGLVIGLDVQPFSAQISSAAGVSTNGIFVRTGLNTVAARSIAQGTNILVTNGDGADGNPTVAVVASPQFTALGVGTAASATTGEIRATDNITAYFSSDKKFKENIQEIQGALDKVVAIGGKTFDWTDEYIETHGGEDGYFIQKSDFGVIAQDVEQQFPAAVRTREDGTLAVDYAKLSALAFAAIAELKKEIDTLKGK